MADPIPVPTEILTQLVLNFEICQSNDCSSLTFVETTGLLSETNLTGWDDGLLGSSNPTTGDATSAVLTITLASGNTYDIDLFATGFFPTYNDTFEYVIPNESFGYTTGSAIADQIMSFTYTVVALGETYTQTVQQAFYCQAQCCVMSMFLGIDSTCDNCNEDKMDRALKAYALLKGLIAAANCGNSTYFNNILAQVNKLCLNSNCQNCK